jgi:hypothetical protein
MRRIHLSRRFRRPNCPRIQHYLSTCTEGILMYRRSSILLIGAILAISSGCRCWDSSCRTTSNANCNQPYRLVGNAKPISEGCYDAVTGVPCPCPPPGSGMVIPGGGYPAGPMPQPMAPPNELPYPNPNIPPTSIPSAVPFPAPGFGSSMNSNVTQPVKTSPNK